MIYGGALKKTGRRRRWSPTDHPDVEVFTATEKRADEEECRIVPADVAEPKPNLKRKSNFSGPSQGDEDLVVLAERGQVACRDYPHARHLCTKYPFEKTSHESFCHLCYCYICDAAAPCNKWKGISGHCHASDQAKKWRSMRRDQRVRSLATKIVTNI